ncbi:MAG: hypothetical protein AAGC93_18745 [Cyanobacteria bacterium P01_F01_bin.53]
MVKNTFSKHISKAQFSHIATQGYTQIPSQWLKLYKVVRTSRKMVVSDTSIHLRVVRFSNALTIVPSLLSLKNSVQKQARQEI